jgi:hypothetical protein
MSFTEGTVPDVLSRDGRFGTLLFILANSESTQGPPGQQTTSPVLELMARPSWQHTLFAQTDASFAALSRDVLEILLTDAEARLTFVRFHVSQRVWAAGELPESGTIESPAGRIDVSRNGDRVIVGNATIVDADVAATNGVIHVVEGFVWLPPD